MNVSRTSNSGEDTEPSPYRPPHTVATKANTCFLLFAAEVSVDDYRSLLPISKLFTALLFLTLFASIPFALMTPFVLFGNDLSRADRAGFTAAVFVLNCFSWGCLYAYRPAARVAAMLKRGGELTGFYRCRIDSAGLEFDDGLMTQQLDWSHIESLDIQSAGIRVWCKNNANTFIALPKRGFDWYDRVTMRRSVRTFQENPTDRHAETPPDNAILFAGELRAQDGDEAASATSTRIRKSLGWFATYSIFAGMAFIAGRNYIAAALFFFACYYAVELGGIAYGRRRHSERSVIAWQQQGWISDSRAFFAFGKLSFETSLQKFREIIVQEEYIQFQLSNGNAWSVPRNHLQRPEEWGQLVDWMTKAKKQPG